MNAPMSLGQQLEGALGRQYRVVREFGAAGMSRVFLARDEALNRDVVVKVLPPELAAGVSTERFKREIQISAALQHPHIVPVLSAGEVDGLPFYAMPYVRGESLRAVLDARKRLSVSEASSVLRDVARALAFAHRAGVAHRDVKPENVLLSDGIAVVADFGIAKALSSAGRRPDSETLTRTGTSIGTPTYMAPEQAAADPSTDHRADIYALGVVGYELLAGKPPFHGRTPRDLLAAHMTEVPRPIEELRSDVPPSIARLLARCLAKDPDARPQTADEIVTAIESTLANSGERLASGLADEPRRVRQALLIYAFTFLVVAGAAWAAMIGLGLPDWVLPGAMMLMALGLPVVAVTGATRMVARRAIASTRAPQPRHRFRDDWKNLAVRGTRHLSWRRVAISGAVALGAFAFAVAGFMLLRAVGIGAPGTLFAAGAIAPRAPLLIADFGSHADDTTLARLATHAVTLGLQQSGSVDVLAPETISDARRRMRLLPSERITLSRARELAIREGVPVIVDGDLVRNASGHLLSVRLVAGSSGEILASRAATAASPADLIAAADKVTRELRSKIGESLKQIRRTPPLAQATTESLEALELYTRAMRLWHVEGNLRGAVEPLKQAVAVDTAFAGAWRALGVLVGSNLRSDPPLAMEALARAYRHRARATLRERLLIEGTYHSGSRPDADIRQAMAAYEEAAELTGTPPTNLGWLLNLRREFVRAESLYRALHTQGNLPALAYEDFVVSLVNQGKAHEADSVAQAALRTFPNRAGMAWLPRRLQCGLRRFDACDAAMDSTIADGGDDRAAAMRIKAAMLVMRGRIAEAERWLASAGQVQRRRFADAILRADIDTWVLRRPTRALSRLDSLGDSIPRQNLLGISARYADAGNARRARELLARWERVFPDSVRSQQQRQLGLASNQAGIAEAEGRWRDAMQRWQEFDVYPLDGKPLGYCMQCMPKGMARAYDALNHVDSAIVWYERLVATPQYFNGEPDLWLQALNLPHAFERLAQLYEQQANRDKAAVYYKRFIEMWREADPALEPRVADARRRLAVLRPARIDN